MRDYRGSMYGPKELASNGRGNPKPLNTEPTLNPELLVSNVVSSSGFCMTPPTHRYIKVGRSLDMETHIGPFGAAMWGCRVSGLQGLEFRLLSSELGSRVSMLQASKLPGPIFRMVTSSYRSAWT